MTHRIEVSDMSVPGRAAGPLLLDYTLSTVPARLRVSTATQDRLGRLDLTVTGGTTASPYYCEQITITLPIGPGPTQLTEAGLGVIAREVTGGSGGNQGRGWDITETPGNTRRTFTCTPRHEARFDGTWTLKLSLIDIPLNRQPGDAPITIAESTRTTDGDYETREETVPITKSPPEFIFTDFRPENIAVPRTQAVKLHWVCDGDADATFTLFWNGNTEAIGKGVRQWPPAGRTVTITKDTSFMLRANTKNPSGGDEYHYQTIVINCTDPDLNANTLNVAGITNLNGTTNLKTATVAGTTNLNGTTNTKDLTVNSGYTLTANGPVTLAGATSLNGSTTTRNLTVNSGYTLTANGPVTLAGATTLNGSTTTRNLTVNSGYTLTVNGDFVVNGKVNIFRSSYQIARYTSSTSGTWYAPTAGLIMVRNDGGDGFFRAQITVNGVTAGATIDSSELPQVVQAAVMPVNKDQAATLSRFNCNQAALFTFHPMGA
ncbi:hypothetical protein ACFYN3_42520 [Streptomyces lavendulae]|uniref:hypothetical protein n=1 Tax=Streptomyces lavendulae TaxID=1914 RepID=UPI0036AD6C91